MTIPPIDSGRIASLALLALLCLPLHSGSTLSSVSPLAIRMEKLPRHILWAWERPEDLRAIDPRTTEVAYLDQTVLIGPPSAASGVIGKPRRQPLALPSGAQRIAVVRIEVTPGANLEAAESEIIAQLLQTATTPGIAALQIDFDATRSQHVFYRHLLRDLRAQMPSDLPLSITALASWCSYDDWLRGLPIDEAVPMMFRMEPDRRRLSADLPELQIHEPLCRTSVGISTREPWPENIAGKRLYIFPDHGWTIDMPLIAERKLP